MLIVLNLKYVFQNNSSKISKKKLYKIPTCLCLLTSNVLSIIVMHNFSVILHNFNEINWLNRYFYYIWPLKNWSLTYFVRLPTHVWALLHMKIGILVSVCYSRFLSVKIKIKCTSPCKSLKGYLFLLLMNFLAQHLWIMNILHIILNIRGILKCF